MVEKNLRSPLERGQIKASRHRLSCEIRGVFEEALANLFTLAHNQRSETHPSLIETRVALSVSPFPSREGIF